MPETQTTRRHMHHHRPGSVQSSRSGRGFSLVELLATLAIVALLASMALVRVMDPSTQCAGRACQVNQRDIELQAQLWYREHGVWPANDLSDIGSDARYFPGGLPTCPIDGSSYELDPSTHKVTEHAHP